MSNLVHPTLSSQSPESTVAGINKASYDSDSTVVGINKASCGSDSTVVGINKASLSPDYNVAGINKALLAAYWEWKSCIGAARRIVETEKGETAKILPFPPLPFQAPAFAKRGGRGEGGQQQAGVENEAGEA